MDNAYYNMGNGKWDILLPDNDGDSCAIVASIQLMQYLDRKSILDTTTRFINTHSEINYDPFTNLDDFYKNCLGQKMHDILDEMVFEGFWGENYSIGLSKSLNDFVELYQPLDSNGQN